MPLTQVQSGMLGNPQLLGFKNKLINGNFDFWQRGTTGTTTTSGSAVTDRWQYLTDGTLNTATTLSRQTFPVGQTAVPNNPTYALQIAYTSVNTPSNYIRQRIENVATLAGETATFSFFVRTTSGTIIVGAQFQQEFGTGGSPSAGVYGILANTFTATTTWQRFSISGVITSISGKTIGANNDSALNAAITFPAGGASGSIQVAQCQVEAGVTATDYDIRPLATEYPMCLRYFYQGALSGSGCSGGATSQFNAVAFPQPMRATPTIAWISGGRIGQGVNDTAVTGLNGSIGGTNSNAVLNVATATYGTAGNGIVLYNSPIFSLNAEL